jgi:quaternary ammonium compound-resistance protein SugE
MSSWMWLGAAGAVEVLMAVALKRSEAWTRLLPSVVGLVAALVSIFLLTLALKRLPLGTAYAVWTAIGAVGVALVGVMAFGESLSPWRLGCIGLVVAGTVGLRMLEG